MKSIDLNCDMGESPEALADGSQAELMRHITSANIACGCHAGGADTMRATIEQCQQHNVAIGAHPGYEDRANFGRKVLQLSSREITESVYQQIAALDKIASTCGARIRHVKAHGALYNQATRDRGIARAIAEGVHRCRSDVVLVGFAGSLMLEEFRNAGFTVAAEAFADRRYEKDGSLRSRKFTDALLADPEQAAAQALQIVQQGKVTTADGITIALQAQTLCIHGDTPGAAQFASRIHRAFDQAGIKIRALHATGSA